MVHDDGACAAGRGCCSTQRCWQGCARGRMARALANARMHARTRTLTLPTCAWSGRVRPPACAHVVGVKVALRAVVCAPCRWRARPADPTLTAAGGAPSLRCGSSQHSSRGHIKRTPKECYLPQGPDTLEPHPTPAQKCNGPLLRS